MQFKTLAAIAVTSAAVQAQTITNTALPNPSQFSKISSDIATFRTGSVALSADNAVSTWAASLDDAGLPVPDTAIYAPSTGNWVSFVSVINALPSTSISNVPSDVLGAYQTAASIVAGLINNDISGGPTAAASSSMTTSTTGSSTGTTTSATKTTSASPSPSKNAAVGPGLDRTAMMSGLALAGTLGFALVL